MKRLLAVLLAGIPAHASEPPFPPIAVCNNGVCTMKETDFVKFREFHSALVQSQVALEKRAEDLEGIAAQLQNKLNHRALCEALRRS